MKTAAELAKLQDAALTELEAALSAGRSEALTQHLEAVARFHRYSFRNVMLILTQKPEASRVAGFNTWKDLGRFVRKGEKGIAIIAPMRIRKREEETPEAPDEKRAEPGVVGEGSFIRFKVVYVFDISQTDGEPLPEIRSFAGDPGPHAERLKQFVSSLGIELQYRDSIAGADGASTGGKILLRAGLSPAEEFSVLAHETAHELLHRRPGEERPPLTVRETEAEAVAFVVSRAAGLETGSSSSDYIQLYQGDSSTLAASLDRIQQTAARILAALTEDETEKLAA